MMHRYSQNVWRVSLLVFQGLLLCNYCIWVSCAVNNDIYKIGQNVTAIKGSSNAIYILKDNIKHMVMTWDLFASLGYEGKDVHTYTDAVVNAYTTGDTIEVAAPVPEPHKFLCPCVASASHDLSNFENLRYQTSLLYLICIIENVETKRLFSQMSAEHLNVNIRYIPENVVPHFRNSSGTEHIEAATGCDVVINIVSNITTIVKEIDRKCPGICLPIAYTEIPLKWLAPYDFTQSLTCSMSMSSFLSHPEWRNGKTIVDTSINFGIVMASLARRRMEECLERGLWPMGSFSKRIRATPTWSNVSYLLPYKSIIPKRKIYGLILWVGSNNRLDLAMKQTEMLTLQDSSFNDTQKIFGYVATEDVYPCDIEAPNCKHNYGYHWMMPTGMMFFEGNKGWGCAQRRPLRAMAHVLLLFDPDFLFVADDDTYVRAQHLFFGSMLSPIIFGTLRDDPVVMGQLNGGNKVTNKGFFYGGAGYLMGRGLINRLLSHNLSGPSFGDHIRTQKHMDHLGLFEEAYSSLGTCPDCLQLTTPWNSAENVHGIGTSSALQVRLIDLCTNMLSEESTCYHSDHAISRCLVHGAYADVWDIACTGTVVTKEFTTGMCMGVDKCAPHLLSCHRYWPNMTTIDLSPVEYKSKG